MENDRRKRRIRPFEALRAIRVLLRNPDDTGQVFRIIDALSGRAGERTFRRFAADPTGARILAERRSLLAILSDRAALAALPEGTLGRTYADFVGREQLSADGLVEASLEDQGRSPEGSDERLFQDRIRDMHDLWHVVTGYGRDLFGETALLAFSFAQTLNPGVGFIVAVGLLKAETAEERRLIVAAFRRGRRAAWLPASDWEALLARPLADVRRDLHVGEPPRYAGVRSAAAPQLAY